MRGREAQESFPSADDEVVSQPVDVDVPRKFADDREHGRADDVADIGGVSFCGWLFLLCNSKHTILHTRRHLYAYKLIVGVGDC